MTEPTMKSTEQKIKEMNWYKEYWHCSPVQYIRYGLYDKRLSMNELLDYIPVFRFTIIIWKSN